jgi:hypothetical protein
MTVITVFIIIIFIIIIACFQFYNTYTYQWRILFWLTCLVEGCAAHCKVLLDLSPGSPLTTDIYNYTHDFFNISRMIYCTLFLRILQTLAQRARDVTSLTQLKDWTDHAVKQSFPNINYRLTIPRTGRKFRFCGAGVLSYKFWVFKTSDYFNLHGRN